MMSAVELMVAVVVGHLNFPLPTTSDLRGNIYTLAVPPLSVTGVEAGGKQILRIYPDGSFRCVGHPSAKALGELNYASTEALIAYVAMCGRRRKP